MKRSYSLLLGFFCLFFFHAVLGQQKKDGIDSFFPRYLTFSFNSEILKEKRTFIINLPEGYSESNEENYPVVYLLDAENNFPFTSSLIEKLRSRAIPKSILVGIINTNRTRDLTPIHSINPQENGITKGGADNFRQMLVDELIPYVEKKFRTNNFKTLIGHSYGGLFIVNTLSNAQELFNAYICISPSLWWDKQKEVDLFEDYIRSEKEMNSILYLTMANEEGAMRGGLLKLIGILETENPENLRWAYNILPDENHGSIIIPSQIEGFNFIYKDWYVSNVKEEFEKNGLEGFEL